MRRLRRAAALLPAPMASVVRREVAPLSCLVLLVRRRRHGVRPGVVSFGYAAALRPMSLVLLSVGVLELVAVELLVPWHAVRVVLLVVGLYTLMALLGMTAAVVVRPHLVGAGELRLRAGTWADVRVPLDRVAAARARVRTAPGRPTVVEQELVIGVLGATDVDVRLTGPTSVRLGHDSVEVLGLRFAADDPAAAVRALTGAAAPQRAGPAG